MGSSTSAASRASHAVRAAGPAALSGVSASPAARAVACGLPIRPQGRHTSTTAITTNSTTRVSLENDKATPPTSTRPIQMHSAFSSAISNAATKTPGSEPMPPTTTTTKAAPMVCMSSSRLAGSRGSCSAPPSPASKAPRANTLVNSQAWFTPRAPTISRSCVAARTSVPQRVRCSSHHRAASTTGPMAINSRSYAGNGRPRTLTEPSSPGARGPNSSSGPQAHSTASFTTSTSAKVANSCSSSGAR